MGVLSSNDMIVENVDEEEDTENMTYQQRRALNLKKKKSSMGRKKVIPQEKNAPTMEANVKVNQTEEDEEEFFNTDKSGT